MTKNVIGAVCLCGALLGATLSSAEETTSTKASGSELTGRVVKAEGKTLYLEHQGVIIPLKIDASTRIESAAGKTPQDLEGRQVKASVTVQNTITNVATVIRLDSTAGTGGSGDEPDRAGPPGADEPERVIPDSSTGAGTGAAPGNDKY